MMERRTNAEVLANPSPVQRRAGDGARGWRFDAFEFDLRRSELKGPDGATIPLRPKAEALLRRFLQRPQVLLGREELMASVWPTTVVTDDSLVQCVRELRTALGDQSARLIRTVPRRGYRFEASVDPLDPPADAPVAPTPSPPSAVVPPARSSRTALVGAGLALLVALGAGAAWQWRAALDRPDIDAQIAARHVFAVMPFEADEPGLRTGADRIADQIAVEIAKWPGTRCIGPARTVALRGTALATFPTELGATYVLTGRVSRATGAPAAVVDIQLLAIPGGDVLGAERFELGTGPDAGSDLGQQVMNFLRGRVGAIDDARALRPGHEPDGADRVLLGWNLISRRQGAPDRAAAWDHFERALRLDPDSVLALDGLGAVYMQQRSASVVLRPEQAAAAEQAIDRALRVAPNDATASMLWGNLQLLEGRPELAIPAMEKANRITPAFANGHLLLARALLSAGRTDEAIPEAERALRLATISRDTARISGALQLGAEAALMRHDDARALELARRAVGERPGSGQAHAVLGAVEALAGLPDLAAAEIAIARRLSPQTTLANFDASRPSHEPPYVAARARLYGGLRSAGMADH